MGERWNAYGGSVGKPEGKRPLGGHKHRLEDIIKMDVDWINLAHDRDKWPAFMIAVMNFRVL